MDVALAPDAQLSHGQLSCGAEASNSTPMRASSTRLSMQGRPEHGSPPLLHQHVGISRLYATGASGLPQRQEALALACRGAHDSAQQQEPGLCFASRTSSRPRHRSLQQEAAAERTDRLTPTRSCDVARMRDDGARQHVRELQCGKADRHSASALWSANLDEELEWAADTLLDSDGPAASRDRDESPSVGILDAMQSHQPAVEQEHTCAQRCSTARQSVTAQKLQRQVDQAQARFAGASGMLTRAHPPPIAARSRHTSASVTTIPAASSVPVGCFVAESRITHDSMLAGQEPSCSAANHHAVDALAVADLLDADHVAQLQQLVLSTQGASRGYEPCCHRRTDHDAERQSTRAAEQVVCESHWPSFMRVLALAAAHAMGWACGHSTRRVQLRPARQLGYRSTAHDHWVNEHQGCGVRSPHPVCEARRSSGRRASGRASQTATPEALKLLIPRALPPSPPLVFNASFESANLRGAVRIGEFEYDLFLSPDLNDVSEFGTRCQWFYFAVSGAAPDQQYRLNICNFNKSYSLYNRGAQPLVACPDKPALLEKQLTRDIGRAASLCGWHRTGSDISYHPSPYRVAPQQLPPRTAMPASTGARAGVPARKAAAVAEPADSASEKLMKSLRGRADAAGTGLYCLSFTMAFPSADRFFVATCYPYSLHRLAGASATNGGARKRARARFCGLRGAAPLAALPHRGGQPL